MKIAVMLDYVIADLRHRTELYEKQLQVQIDDPFYAPKLLNNDSFWAGMRQFKDFELFKIDPAYYHHELWIFSRRPTHLHNITKAWLDRKGFDNCNLLVQSIPRYDCRMLGIDLYLDINRVMLESFQYDATQPVFLNRDGNIKTEWMKTSWTPAEIRLPDYVKAISWPEEVFGLENDRESPWKV